MKTVGGDGHTAMHGDVGSFAIPDSVLSCLTIAGDVIDVIGAGHALSISRSNRSLSRGRGKTHAPMK